MNHGQSTSDLERPLGPRRASPSWTFLSNHAHVLLCIMADRSVRLRDVSLRVGITERAVQRIVAELEDGGYLTRVRSGRRNRYEVHLDRPPRHPIEAQHSLMDLIGNVRPSCAVAFDENGDSEDRSTEVVSLSR